MNISLHEHLPLYAQVEAMLVASIADDTFPPEMQLPSEDSLIERFAVSQTAIHAAIQNLSQRGLVEIRRLATQPKITQELAELSGFVEERNCIRVLK